MKTIESTCKTEFYLDDQLLSDKKFINLDWGKGSIVTLDQVDYEIINIFDIGVDVAKANVKLKLTEW